MGERDGTILDRRYTIRAAQGRRSSASKRFNLMISGTHQCRGGDSESAFISSMRKKGS
jgi:hypothetical protein